MKQPTCENIIDSRLESRIDQIAAMFAAMSCGISDYDDWRQADTNERLTAIQAMNEASDASLSPFAARSDDMPEELGPFREYGLSFDCVLDDDTDEPDYWRFQISWGGPSDEFRFYPANDERFPRVEYVYMDWFDGATRTLSHRDLHVMREVWGYLLDCDAVDSALCEAS